MKRYLVSAAALLLYSSVVVAQTPADKPAGGPAPAPQLVTGNEHKHAREADVRHCLNLNDDRAIMRCAEPYRYRRAR